MGLSYVQKDAAGADGRYADTFLNAAAGQIVPYDDRRVMQNAVQAAYDSQLSQAAYYNDATQQWRDVSQNVTPQPVVKNTRGQTYPEWRDGYEARQGMVEASGFPIGEVEQQQIDGDLAEWHAMGVV